MFKTSKKRYLLNKAIPYLSFMFNGDIDHSKYENKRVLKSHSEGETWLLKTSLDSSQSNFKNRKFS